MCALRGASGNYSPRQDYSMPSSAPAPAEVTTDKTASAPAQSNASIKDRLKNTASRESSGGVDLRNLHAGQLEKQMAAFKTKGNLTPKRRNPTDDSAGG